MAVAHFYTGSYSRPLGAIEGKGIGLSSFQLDLNDGKITPHLYDLPLANPSYLVQQDKVLVTINEVDQIDKPGLHLFKRHDDHSLSQLDVADIGGSYPCHLAISPDGQWIATASYGCGGFDLYRVNPDSSLEHVCQIKNASPQSLHPRQDGPHAHFVQFNKKSNQLITVDLGTDTISFYHITQNQLSKDNAYHLTLPEGSGPRHLVFSKDETQLFVLCELTEQILHLSYINNEWQLIDSVSPYSGQHSSEAAAAIRLNNEGNMLYVSGRGHSEIVCVSLENKMSVVQTIALDDKNPRDFALSPCGSWLVVAHQDSHSVSSYRLDRVSGKCTYSGFSVETGNPVCVSFSPD